MNKAFCNKDSPPSQGGQQKNLQMLTWSASVMDESYEGVKHRYANRWFMTSHLLMPQMLSFSPKLLPEVLEGAEKQPPQEDVNCRGTCQREKSVRGKDGEFLTSSSVWTSPRSNTSDDERAQKKEKTGDERGRQKKSHLTSLRLNIESQRVASFLRSTPLSMQDSLVLYFSNEQMNEFKVWTRKKQH